MTCAIISEDSELSAELKNESSRSCIKLKKRLKEFILAAYAHGYDRFYTNCEYGVPLWAAEIICKMKMAMPIELHIVIPYEEQATKWGQKRRDRYYKVNEQCDSVCFASTRYHESCYRNANEIMLKNSDRVLAYNVSSDNCYAVDYVCTKRPDVGHSFI